MLLEQLAEGRKLDIHTLEKLYKQLPPKVKEVVPSNIKGWLLFQKQIDNLYYIQDNLHTPELEKIFPTLPGLYSQWMEQFLQAVIQDMPYKHSIVEAYEEQVANDYLYRGGINIELYGYVRIKTYKELKQRYDVRK